MYEFNRPISLPLTILIPSHPCPRNIITYSCKTPRQTHLDVNNPIFADWNPTRITFQARVQVKLLGQTNSILLLKFSIILKPYDVCEQNNFWIYNLTNPDIFWVISLNWEFKDYSISISGALCNLLLTFEHKWLKTRCLRPVFKSHSQTPRKKRHSNTLPQ
jgi:hypothetical protein